MMYFLCYMCSLQDVLRYTLEGNPVSVNGLQYFGINSNTGRISVIQPLTADVAKTSQYVVSNFCSELVYSEMGNLRVFSQLSDKILQNIRHLNLL